LIVLLIGGSGSLGKHMIPVLMQNPQIDRIRIMSRGEHTQMEMQDSLPKEWRQKIDFFVGDVRDMARVEEASKDCQMVYHLAAMKSVDKAEYDPWEAVLTNIIGAKNVIEATKKNHVSKAIFISTDKAVNPINIYGASKLVAEKLFIQANIGKHPTLFSVCRYGNVFGSNGSVVKKWKEQIATSKKLKVTHEEMTRFFLLPTEAAKFVVHRSYEARGGEVFIPKMKSTTMLNLARAFADSIGKTLSIEDIDWIGIRPGEKMHEALIAPDEVELTTDCVECFIRWPNQNLFPVLKKGTPVDKAFTSHNAERFQLDELKEMITWEYESSQKWVQPMPEKSNMPKKPSIDAWTSESTLLNSNSSRKPTSFYDPEMSGSTQISI
jgi:UDP-N-acetylglucosamine 4,6-dehydratase